MFLFSNNAEFASYADNNKSYYNSNGPEDVISKFQKSSKINFKYFESNSMKANPVVTGRKLNVHNITFYLRFVSAGKCPLLTPKTVNFHTSINENNVTNTKFKKRQRITFDNRLFFNLQVSNLCKMTSNKLNPFCPGKFEKIQYLRF